jgi:hypothetical protein
MSFGRRQKLSPVQRESEVADYPQDTVGNKPEVAQRFLALSLYLGFAPSVWFCRKRFSSSYLNNHYGQSMALWGLLGTMTASLIFMVLVLSILMIRYQEWMESQTVEVWIISFGRKCLLVWLVFWLYSVWRCLRGIAVLVPYLAVLSMSFWFHRAGVACASLFFVAVTALVPLTIQADQLVVNHPDHGKIYMLYDDLGIFPRGLFSVAMYRLAYEGQKKWGYGSAVLLPLDRDGINHALSTGIFVFVGSHGTAQGLLLRDGYYRPADVPENSGKDLAYVYLAGCDSGVQREAWEEALHPAKVKTYDRLTPTLEHLWWLWTEGPGIVRNLPKHNSTGTDRNL